MLRQTIPVFGNKFLQTKCVGTALLRLGRGRGNEKLIADFRNFLQKCEDLRSFYDRRWTIWRTLIHLLPSYSWKPQFDNISVRHLRWNKILRNQHRIT